eukprot:TRINITY_DN66877_c16_g2_i1.p1 TRINITY_DN66877_c16_g2~~TRINITY_DN66877_c16_g2_i1.p1  ORF type:complete len:394 (-),score=89.08 TRINITY_DN66877_c16_g2_i1:385-1566(-)
MLAGLLQFKQDSSDSDSSSSDDDKDSESSSSSSSASSESDKKKKKKHKKHKDKSKKKKSKHKKKSKKSTKKKKKDKKEKKEKKEKKSKKDKDKSADAEKERNASPTRPRPSSPKSMSEDSEPVNKAGTGTKDAQDSVNTQPKRKRQGEVVGPQMPENAADMKTDSGINNPYASDFVGPRFSSAQLKGDDSSSDDDLPVWATKSGADGPGGDDAGDGKLVREDWMSMVPEIGDKPLDFASRKFKTKVRPAGEKGKDHGGWTRDPKKKRGREDGGSGSESDDPEKRREAEDNERRNRAIQRRIEEKDEKTRQMVAEYNKAKRPKTLQEMHDEKRLAETKARMKKGETKEVRDWDYERDFVSHGLVDSKRLNASIQNAAGQLSSKFAKPSSGSAFL